MQGVKRFPGTRPGCLRQHDLAFPPRTRSPAESWPSRRRAGLRAWRCPTPTVLQKLVEGETPPGDERPFPTAGSTGGSTRAGIMNPIQLILLALALAQGDTAQVRPPPSPRHPTPPGARAAFRRRGGNATLTLPALHAATLTI